MNSADVSAGDQTLATQYNNLRTDVTDLGHVQIDAGAGGISEFNLVYPSASDTILKASADAAGTSNVIGMARETIGAGSACWVQMQGIVTNAGWAWTPCAKLYLSTTAGGMTEDVKTLIQTKKQIVVVGFAITATKIILRIEPQSSVGI